MTAFSYWLVSDLSHTHTFARFYLAKGLHLLCLWWWNPCFLSLFAFLLVPSLFLLLLLLLISPLHTPSSLLLHPSKRQKRLSLNCYCHVTYHVWAAESFFRFSLGPFSCPVAYFESTQSPSPAVLLLVVLFTAAIGLKLSHSFLAKREGEAVKRTFSSFSLFLSPQYGTLDVTWERREGEERKPGNWRSKRPAASRNNQLKKPFPQLQFASPNHSMSIFLLLFFLSYYWFLDREAFLTCLTQVSRFPFLMNIISCMPVGKIFTLARTLTQTFIKVLVMK